MLVELTVTDLGPVAGITLVFGPGMTAMTGETGAGKTIVTEAIKLLCGAKADAVMVRSGAKEAVVEGRFVTDNDELVVRRVVPASGRSRGYLQGQMASTAELAAVVGELVDIHGQNGHQSLVRPQAQRSALDQFGNVDTALLRDLRRQLAELDAQLTELGGDERARAREIELVRYQFDEIVAASIIDADEDNRLRSREDLLADAGDYRDSARDAGIRLGGDEGAGDIITRILHRLENVTPFAHLVSRLKSLELE
ncbi:MAG: AAA family ATPase, partial [Acidimicrobiales bacterium]